MVKLPVYPQMSLERQCRPLLRCSTGFSTFQHVVEDNDNFDAGIKSAVLKASSSVASLISRTGDVVVFIGSGIIIECVALDGSFWGTILTCATLLKGCGGAVVIPPNLKIDVYLSGGKLYEGQVLTYDFYHNIATIKIQSNTPLSTSKIRYIDDSLSIGRKKSEDEEDSTRFTLCPGEPVISLARHAEHPHEVMASPGFYSCDDCTDDCKDLFSTTCTVNMVAIGGPLINCFGEVIGVNFTICPFNAFLPMNIAIKCLDYLKKKGQAPRPWLGVGVANLYTSKLEKLEELTRKFPHVVKGVVVEQIFDKSMHSSMKRRKVIHQIFGSPRTWLKAKIILENLRKKRRSKTRVTKIKANQRSLSRFSGLRIGDVITGCDGISVGSYLELVEILWNKERKSVELTVVRPNIGQRNLTMVVGTGPMMNRWLVLTKGILPTIGDRLAIERNKKMNAFETEE